MTSKKLGKGLGSLLSNSHALDADEPQGPAWVPVEHLQPSSQQPRLDVERGVGRLANSIRKHGILQPIVVTKNEDGSYQILAGERRWRAAQGAGMKKVPILVREGLRSEAERLELALIENVQREDLNPIERATACRTLIVDFGLSQQEVAEGLGYERSTIANLVRLLELPDEIQAGVSRETISAGHARALLRVADPALQAAVYQRIQTEGLSVRKAEALAAAAAKGKLTPVHKPRPRQAAWVTQLQEKLTRAVGSRAEIRTRRGGGGRLVFHFQDLDELDRLTQGFALPGEAEELLGSN